MFWSQHLSLTLIACAGVFSCFILGALGAQLVDVDHTASWRVKARCAILNTAAACPSDLLGRGIGHTLPFLLAVVGFTVFVNGGGKWPTATPRQPQDAVSKAAVSFCGKLLLYVWRHPPDDALLAEARCSLSGKTRGSNQSNDIFHPYSKQARG